MNIPAEKAFRDTKLVVNPCLANSIWVAITTEVIDKGTSEALA